MNARIVALATVLDVVVLMGLGLGLFFAPLTLIWAFDDGFSTDLLFSWAASLDLWLLGHGVPLAFSLPVELADSLSLGSLSREFIVDVALLGVGLLSLLWGYRIGRRESTIRYPLMVWTLSVATMVGATFLLVFFAPAHVVEIQLIDALVRPSLFLAAGLAIATWVGPDSIGKEVLSKNLPEGAFAVVRSSFVAGLGSVFALLTVSAIAVAIVLVASFSRVISLYEALQPGIFGIIALSVAQLALLPTLIVWAATFLVGPGFALGSGAIVSPLGTELQTVPALPILGIIPSNPPAIGIIVVAIPLLLAVVAGLSVRSRLIRDTESLWGDMHTTGFFGQPFVRMFLTAVLSAFVAAALGGFLAEMVSGQMGPGRFAVVGPESSTVALWLGIEVGVGVFLGVLSGSLSSKLALSSR